MQLFSEWELVDNNDSFKKNAACKDADPAIFFPESAANKLYKQAVAICATCPVYKDCMRYAINNDIQFGVWGGLTPQQRARDGKQILESLESQ